MITRDPPPIVRTLAKYLYMRPEAQLCAPDECKKWSVVTAVRSPEGRNISVSPWTASNEIFVTPSEHVASVSTKEQVGGDAGVAPVAVGKRMNAHQAMTKSCCNLVYRPGIALDLRLDVAE